MFNSEKVLARLHEILALTPDQMPAPLRDLAADVSAMVRADYAARKGVSSPLRAMNALIKSFRKSNYREELHYAWTDGKGRQCWTDAVIAFRLVDHLPLEPRPDHLMPEPIDLDKIFPASFEKYSRLDLPSPKDVRASIAVQRAENGSREIPLWDFGFRRPLVNASLLLDVMTVLPGATEIYVKAGSPISPLFIRCSAGEAALFPCRPDPKSEKAAEFYTDAHTDAPSGDCVSVNSHVIRLHSFDITPDWHFTRSEVIKPDGSVFLAEYSVTPRESVVVLWSEGDKTCQLRVVKDIEDPLYREVLNAARPAPAAPQPVEEAPKAIPQVENPAAVSDNAPAPVEEAPAPVLLLPAPPVAALLPAPVEEAPKAVPQAENPSPKAAHGPIPEKTFIDTTIQGAGWRIHFDPATQRTRVFVESNASAAFRKAIEQAGFCWSSSMQSFNKKLTSRAYRAAQALAQSLRSLSA
mgnify:CR=1 FL=1